LAHIYSHRLPVDVSKKFNTAASSKDGEFDTSTTTAALSRASAKPSPVSVLTPECGDAGTTWWPCSRRLRTSFEPKILRCLHAHPELSELTKEGYSHLAICLKINPYEYRCER
jgi:hypothetical protein